MKAFITYTCDNGHECQKTLIGTRNNIVDKAIWFGDTHAKQDTFYKVDIYNQDGVKTDTFSKLPHHVTINGKIDPWYTKIMNPYNGHNVNLVNKICEAWDNEKHYPFFKQILFAFASRDAEEIWEKLGIKIKSEDEAMDYAHEIMEHICDDLDLECILKFVRFD